MILAELTDLALCLAALALGPVVYQLSTAKRSYSFQLRVVIHGALGDATRPGGVCCAWP